MKWWQMFVAVLVLGLAACGPSVVSVSCPEGQPPTVVIDPLPGGGATSGVVSYGCGDVVKEVWMCDQTKLVCSATPPYVHCVQDSGSRKLTVSDPDGFKCGGKDTPAPAAGDSSGGSL
jgi:hypothetical protein